MTPDEARRLELARAAWQASAPSDDDTELAVRRLSRQLARRPARDPARRVLSVGAAVLVFGAALAYAASGGLSLPRLLSPSETLDKPKTAPAGVPSASAESPVDGRGSHTPPPAAPTAPLKPTPTAPAQSSLNETAPARPKPTARALLPTLPPSADESTPAIDPAPAPGEPPPAPAGVGAESAAVPGESTTWRDVSRALAARDDRSAKQALESLGRSEDASTRAKARLGLAQLAASRGDCVRARALAAEVAASAEADARTAARARALAARCAK